MIHQIWFDLGKGNIPLKPNGIDSMKHYCRTNDIEYKLWSQKEADDIISQMSHKIQYIWKHLPHLINKVDFFRYILLFNFGGMYFDIDFHCIHGIENLNIENTLFLCEEWPFSFKNGSLHNGVLICKSSNHPFWIDIFSEIENRLKKLTKIENSDIQKSVFQLTGTAMLRDVAYSYMNNKQLLMQNIVIMPYGFFCPLVCRDGSYIDSYDDFSRVRHAQTWSVPSIEIIGKNARNFTFGFLGGSVKVWQNNFIKS